MLRRLRIIADRNGGSDGIAREVFAGLLLRKIARLVESDPNDLALAAPSVRHVFIAYARNEGVEFVFRSGSSLDHLCRYDRAIGDRPSRGQFSRAALAEGGP